MVSSSAVPIFFFCFGWFGVLSHYYYLLLRATFASIILEGVGGLGDSFSLSLSTVMKDRGLGSLWAGGEGGWRGGVLEVDLWRGITMAYRSLA